MESKRKSTNEKEIEITTENMIPDSDLGNNIDSVEEPPEKRVASASMNILTSENLADHAQSIIDEIEVKRKNDETLVSEFRKTMELQTESWCDILEQTLAKMYEKNNNACQEKLQELYAVLGRINVLEQEMCAFRQSLKVLYSEVETS